MTPRAARTAAMHDDEVRAAMGSSAWYVTHSACVRWAEFNQCSERDAHLALLTLSRTAEELARFTYGRAVFGHAEAPGTIFLCDVDPTTMQGPKPVLITVQARDQLHLYGPHWYVTQHALDRWCDRYEPELTRDDAAVRLHTLSAGAVPAGITRDDGKPVLQHPDLPHVHFVVATDRRTPSLITVLDADAGMRTAKAVRSLVPYDQRRTSQRSERERDARRETNREARHERDE